MASAKGAPPAAPWDIAQVLRYLDGECTEDEARLATVAGTRKFARRQDAWFRRDPRIVWLPYDADDLLGKALDVVRSTL